MTDRQTRSHAAATVALACFAVVALGLLLMHGLRPDYELRSHMISDYAVGPHGGVMQGVFLTWSVGMAALAAALATCGTVSIPRGVGVLLLAVSAAGLVVSALYKTDLPGMPDTAEGNIHGLSFLVNVASMLVAIPLLSWSFDARGGLAAHRPLALALAAGVVLGFVLQFFTLRKGMPYGLTNRLFVVVLLAWLLTTAYRLRRA